MSWLEFMARKSDPYGHIPRAVCRHLVFTIDHALHMDFRYLLLFFRLIFVRLLDFTFNAAAAGPSPVASVPWHTAQYSRNNPVRAIAVVDRAGTRLILGTASADSMPSDASAATNMTVTRLVGIILSHIHIIRRIQQHAKKRIAQCSSLRRFRRKKGVSAP